MATVVPPSASTPTTRPSASRSQSQPVQSSPAARTPVTFAPTSHLDPSAYVRGTYAINIGSDVLIHPRAHLLSIHSPLTINEGSIIAEKSIIGGPLPPSSSLSTTEPPPTPTPPSDSTPTSIGRFVHIYPNVTINAGAKIGDFSILESNVTIQHGAAVGEHTKICAGVTLSRDVPDWTVVYGLAGEQRRRRRQRAAGIEKKEEEGDGTNEAATTIEAARLRTMNAERESTMMILRKAVSRGIPSRSKR